MRFFLRFWLQILGRIGLQLLLLRLADRRLVCNTFVLHGVGKERKGWLMGWVEKASFDRFNKLFVIFVSERNYQTLLTDRNLLVVVRESQSYVLPIIS